MNAHRWVYFAMCILFAAGDMLIGRGASVWVAAMLVILSTMEEKGTN